MLVREKPLTLKIYHQGKGLAPSCKARGQVFYLFISGYKEVMLRYKFILPVAYGIVAFVILFDVGSAFSTSYKSTSASTKIIQNFRANIF